MTFAARALVPVLARVPVASSAVARTALTSRTFTAVVIGDASHAVFVDRPERFNEAVGAILEDLGR